MSKEVRHLPEEFNWLGLGLGDNKSVWEMC